MNTKNTNLESRIQWIWWQWIQI